MWWNTTNSVLRITTCLILTKWLARAVVNLYWSKVIERIRLHRWSWYNCLEITVLTTMHFLKVIFFKAKRKRVICQNLLNFSYSTFFSCVMYMYVLIITQTTFYNQTTFVIIKQTKTLIHRQVRRSSRQSSAKSISYL